MYQPGFGIYITLGICKAPLFVVPIFYSEVKEKIMPFYAIEAVAYDKDGRRLNGNTHNIEADNQRDAIEIAKSRQKSQVGTVRVETKILRVSDRK